MNRNHNWIISGVVLVLGIMYMLNVIMSYNPKDEYDKVDVLRIIKRVIARCVVASLLWLPRRNCFGEGAV